MMITGCTAGGTPTPPPTTPLKQEGPRLLVATQRPAATPDAGISGVLGVDSAGCVTVHRSTLLAPAGSELRADGTIHLSGIGDYKIGDELPMVFGEVFNASDADPAYQGCESREISHAVAKETV